jgi:hypothetical protein
LLFVFVLRILPFGRGALRRVQMKTRRPFWAVVLIAGGCVAIAVGVIEWSGGARIRSGTSADPAGSSVEESAVPDGGPAGAGHGGGAQGTSGEPSRSARAEGDDAGRFTVSPLALADSAVPRGSGNETAADEASLPPDHAGEEEVTELARLLEILSMRWDEPRKRQAELDQAIADLAALGDSAMEAIMEQYNRQEQTFAFRHRLAQVLGAMGTPRAQEVLRDIALGRSIETNRSQWNWAATTYIGTLRDVRQAADLLDSQDRRVLGSALRALKGQEVDSSLLARLQELMRSEERSVRWAAASVMAADPGSAHAGEKVAAIADALADVKEVRETDQEYARMGVDYSLAEMTYGGYIRSLADMRGADDALRAVSSDVQGEALQAVTIARGLRGDSSVKGSLTGILQDTDAGAMRVWAAEAMGRVGTESDIPLLREVAGSDPLLRDRYQDVGPVAVVKVYPVRDAAQRAIKSIERRTE